MIKKLNNGLKSNLPFPYAAFFALIGLDTSRERKVRAKKMYHGLIRTLRQKDAQQQQQLKKDDQPRRKKI
jgi:hypothetical protein